MRALFDVNVLIALLDSAHIHHTPAMAWLEAEIRHGWASCPITQIGCVRVMSQPSYPGALHAAEVAGRLAEATRSAEHEFWADDVNLLRTDTVDWARVLGHRQVTDSYLLALAVRRGGRLVTFDQRISQSAVHGAESRHLAVLK